MHAFAPRMTAKPASPSTSSSIAFRPATPAASEQARLDATLNRSPRVASTLQLGHALNGGPRTQAQAQFMRLASGAMQRTPAQRGSRSGQPMDEASSLQAKGAQHAGSGTDAARPQPADAPSAREGAVVQREVQFFDLIEIQNRNPVDSVSALMTFADTFTRINGKMIPPNDNRVGLIRPAPTEFGFEDVEGTSPPSYRLRWRVPTQTVRPVIELPTSPLDGQWRRENLTVVQVLSALRSYDVNRESLGVNWNDDEKPCTLVVEPDGDLTGQIKRHEMRHVRENRAAVDDILVPWDTALQRAYDLESTGPLELLAEYDTVAPKESAQDIADRLVDRITSLGEAYHATPEGKDPVLTSVELDREKVPWEFRIRFRLDKV